MQDRLGRRAGLRRVLEAEDAGELVFEPGDLVIEAFFAQRDVVDVRLVGVVGVVDAEDGRTVKAPSGSRAVTTRLPEARALRLS